MTDPDFVYWEHRGMRGVPEYDAKMEKRQLWYKKHGLLDKLIQTDEIGGLDLPKIDPAIERGRISEDMVPVRLCKTLHEAARLTS